MKLPYFIFFAVLFFLNAVFADDDAMPVYPANATHSALAVYYQDLANYYQKKSKECTKKADTEMEYAIKNAHVAPYTIKSTKPWDGTNIGLGLVMNTGDTNTESFNGTSFISYKPNRASTTIWNTTYQNSHDSAKGQVTDYFNTDLNSAFNFDFKNGIYGDINFTRNPFGGYNYQINESIGYNRVYFDNNKFSLTGQFGPGLQQNSQPSPASFQNLITANLTLRANYNFTDQTSLSTVYYLTTNSQNTDNNLDTTLSTMILNQFALKLDYLIDYDTNPLSDKTKLNTTTTLSLVYNF